MADQPTPDEADRVARAIHAEHMAITGPLGAWTWEEASKSFYLRLANVAIAAHTKPHRDMADKLAEALLTITPWAEEWSEISDYPPGKRQMRADIAKAHQALAEYEASK